MKLASFRLAAALPAGSDRGPRLGLVLDDGVVPVAELDESLPASMAELCLREPAAVHEIATVAATSEAVTRRAIPFDEVELLAPVPRPGKIVAVGVNYRSHAAEQNREPPDHPVLFAKLTTSVIGPGATISWDPQLTQAVDYEAELAVVIGRTCRRVEPAQALEFVLGYTCLNDVSARDLQYADRQFVRAKSLDTFCPMGPWLVTPDELGDPQALQIRSLVNGEVRQDASTADMLFGVAELISFCSRAFTLEPGDVLTTGTPAGVGWFREPRQMLHDGDEVAIEIEGIGRLTNLCRERAA
jgi:2-keto-4-pentenoate hydratase/2-oxohepta-3-ene-1,7-dioic acid hydratase in catechol pathway